MSEQRDTKRTIRRLTWFGAGLAATIWFFLRVLPKPSRAAYPCQRVAFPLASSFVVWVMGVLVASRLFGRAGHYARAKRVWLVALCGAAGVAAACFCLSLFPVTSLADFLPGSPNEPTGVAKGLRPGGVVWIYHPDAVSWDGSTGYWWEDANTDQAEVDAMLERALLLYTRETTLPAAWDTLFRHFNRTHGKGDVGYVPGEPVTVKINLNNGGAYGSQDNQTDTSPHLTLSLLRQLANEAGVAPADIAVYDAVRNITDVHYDLCSPEFPDVRYIDQSGAAGRTRVTWSSELVWYGDPTVPGTGQALPQCVVDAEYFINFAALKMHSIAGVTLIGKNLCGSIRGGPSNLHTTMNCLARGPDAFNPIVDLMGHEHHGGKTLLYLIDGLYSSPSPGGSPRRWAIQPFEGEWPASLMLSQDGVAIDSVATDLWHSEATLYDWSDNYLHEAALADDPPSGTVYDPEGDGTPLESLGAHEHWNDPVAKQYTRNLGTGDGIELIWERIVNGSAPDVVTTMTLAYAEPLAEGETLTLRVLIENRSADSADDNLRFVHPLSPGLSDFVMVTPPAVGSWTWDGAASPNGELSFELATLGPGESVELVYDVSVDVTCGLDPYRLCNVGLTSSDWILANEPGPRAADSGDGFPAEPICTPDILPDGNNRVVVTKNFSAPHEPPLVGDVVVYTIAVTNESPLCDVNGAELTDDLPASVIFELSSADITIVSDPGGVALDLSEDPPSGAHSSGRVAITGIDLAAGGETFELTFQVTAWIPASVCNRADVSSAGLAFASDDVCFTVEPVPLPAAITGVRLTKQGDDVAAAQWDEDLAAVSYSLYRVTADPLEKDLIPTANASGVASRPDAIELVCDGLSAPPPGCLDPGGVIAPPDCIFYQVVGVASNGVEGPN